MSTSEEKHEEKYCYPSWEAVIQECPQIEGLNEQEIVGAQAAYRTIAESFGLNFLRYSHPFSRNLCNRAAWTRRWATMFVETLRRIADVENVEKIRRKLRDDETFSEAWMLARMADSFMKSGFRVLFEPSLSNVGSPKIPDLAVADDDGTFYLELANMYPSHDATLSDRMGLWFSIGVMESIGGAASFRPNS